MLFASMLRVLSSILQTRSTPRHGHISSLFLVGTILPCTHQPTDEIRVSNAVLVIACQAEMHSTAEGEIDEVQAWRQIGEGGANLVFAYAGENPELVHTRIAKFSPPPIPFIELLQTIIKNV